MSNLQNISARLAELKEILNRTETYALSFINALREIKEEKLYKQECSSWDEWLRKNVDRTASWMRQLDFQERRKEAARLIAETTGEQPTLPKRKSVSDSQPSKTPVQKSEPIIEIPPAKVISTPVPPTQYNTSVINLLTLLVKDLDSLLHESEIAVNDKFRHCVTVAHSLLKQIQPELPGMGEAFEGAGGKAKATLGSCEQFAFIIGLPRSDGEWFFLKCEGCGWKNNGKPIVDWKATMRSWKIAAVFPSQKLALRRELSKSNNSGPVKVDTRTLQQKLTDEAIRQAMR